MGLSNVTLYFSHIKKEINPHVKDERVIASDILSQFFAADFIGINMKPIRVFKKPIDEIIEESIMKGEFQSKQQYQLAQKLHKSRIFDPESYYYYNINIYPHSLPFNRDSLLNKEEMNKLVNSTILFGEIERTKRALEDQKRIHPYLKNKLGLKENSDILDKIIIEKVRKGQKDLFEILGEL
ncbi:MAG: hypothetical protein ACTSYB_15690 [Candidatus Helarchaeota archaeon]